MTSTELKNAIIDKIYEVDDVSFLEALITILDSKLTKDVIYKLSLQQIDAVKDGKKQITDSDFITNEDLEKNEDEWLKE
jgi:hypothetical protein